MNRFETQKFESTGRLVNAEVCGTMRLAHRALREKGYDPFNQIVGYILSGDPTYITGHLNARTQMSKVDRDELLEEIVRFYIANTKDMNLEPVQEP